LARVVTKSILLRKNIEMPPTLLLIAFFQHLGPILKPQGPPFIRAKETIGLHIIKYGGLVLS